MGTAGLILLLEGVVLLVLSYDGYASERDAMGYGSTLIAVTCLAFVTALVLLVPETSRWSKLLRFLRKS
mgnify:CR=1 FL=1